LYKKKIDKQPKNPEHHINLGNIYRINHQHHLAGKQYKTAIGKGPFYLEPYLAMATMAEEKGNSSTALEWLEKGRPYLKRPLLCKHMEILPREDTMDAYLGLHSYLIRTTKSKIPMIKTEECLPSGKILTKVGRNEKCPCGSGKKYKKCCLRKR
ncbi:MAG: SEC-C domain-containing protein, partial [Desulfobacterales bacterium]|nr:SEC-C domain-containing protein [Desulfobacterales bacterium]